MRFCFTLISFFFLLGGIAQVEIRGLDDLSKKEYKVPQLKYAGLSKDVRQVRLDLVKLGYLASSVDSIVRVDTLKEAIVYFYLGDQFSFLHLEVDSLCQVALSESGKSNLVANRKKVNPFIYKRVIETVIVFYENHGYPFVSVRLGEASWNDNDLEGRLIVDLGERIKFGEIDTKGSLKLDKEVLEIILGFEEGDLFSQEQLDEVDAYLKSFSFIKIVKETEYDFVNNICNVYLYLDKQNANFFDAILGVLPNDNGKVNITGDAKIKLINSLNKGEQFLINWRKLLPLTQNLNLEASVPYVFKLPIGVGGRFDLYKKDTSYLDVVSKIQVQYKFGKNLSFAGFFRNKNSSLLSTEKYQFVTQLPDFADVRNNEYGLQMLWQNLDVRYNPAKGWLSELEVSVGDKKIRKNIALSEELYEGVNLRTTQFYLSGRIDKYFQLYKKNVLKLGVSGGWVANENLFMNELFRLGGLNTLRGFDEESLFASGYAIGTIEYRFLLEEYSNLFVFGQMMYYEQSIKDAYSMDIPYSVGAGINFQTKPGVFSISYSIGSQQNNPLLFRSAKIHFGFVNYF